MFCYGDVLLNRLVLVCFNFYCFKYSISKFQMKKKSEKQTILYMMCFMILFCIAFLSLFYYQ